MSEVSVWVLALIILNLGFLVTRFLKPAKEMVILTDKILHTQQRSHLELAKVAEEISQLKKIIDKNN